MAFVERLGDDSWAACFHVPVVFACMDLCIKKENILNCFCLFFLNTFLYLVLINQMEWSGSRLYYALNCCVLTKASYIMFQSAPNQV